MEILYLYIRIVLFNFFSILFNRTVSNQNYESDEIDNFHRISSVALHKDLMIKVPLASLLGRLDVLIQLLPSINGLVSAF